MTYLINPKITVRQSNIVIGTILGGSSLVKPTKGKNCYLSMRSKDLEWISWKSDELKDVANVDPITKEKTYRWHSICYPLFNDYYKQFYHQNKRTLNIDTLNLLQEMSIAVWFKDCGKIKSNKAIFNTNIWKEKGSKTIIKYFKSLEWECEMFKERNNFRIRLSEDSTQEVLDMMKNLD